MVGLIKGWLEEVNRKQAVRLLLKGVVFSFVVKTEKDIIYVKVENGVIFLDDEMQDPSVLKRIELQADVLQSILSGERKLREAVKHKAAAATFSFRELLLLESLFFLAKPDINYSQSLPETR
ncbi:hypothetical protein R4Z09_24590 [Niallia oryzisoli]|uniref:SCP2 domain-containing protein n=1 Tax=Niallia oryzisoli TaxID=1737571 RepID=A0ABZ2CAT7_9BACI